MAAAVWSTRWRAWGRGSATMRSKAVGGMGSLGRSTTRVVSRRLAVTTSPRLPLPHATPQQADPQPLTGLDLQDLAEMLGPAVDQSHPTIVADLVGADQQ